MGTPMVPIELGDHTSEAEPEVHRRVGRGRRRWIVAVVVVLLALAAGQWAVDTRARSAWEHLAEQTDVVAPLGRSVHPLWTVDPGGLIALGKGARWQGSVVTQLVLPDGSLAVVAIDAKDGRHRWSTALTDPDPALAAQRVAVTVLDRSCTRVPGDVWVACLVNETVGVEKGGTVFTPAAGSADRLLAVDPRDGRIPSDHRLAADVSGAPTTVLPGGLVVLGPVLTAGGAVVVGVDLMSGEERWRRTLPTASSAGFFPPERAGDGVAILVDSTLTLLGPDGAVRRTATVDGRSGLFTRVDRSVAVSTASGTLVVGGDHDLELDGAPIRVVNDDGSLPGVVFTQKDVLEAFGPDGRLLWRGPAPSTGVTVLRGVVYVARKAGVVAIKGSTGTQLWHSDLSLADSPLVTDGRVLLAARSDEVVALDLATGSTLWRSPLPPQYPLVWAEQGLLTAASPAGTGAVVLG